MTVPPRSWRSSRADWPAPSSSSRSCGSPTIGPRSIASRRLGSSWRRVGCAMGDGAIGWGGLAASLLLVAVAIGLSVRRRLGLEATIVWACTRALVQLLLVGYALAAIIEEDAPVGLSWAWV